MLIKGIAKGDKDFRHFTFDDEDYIEKNGVYYYKVNYGKNKLEGEYAEDEIGYVECDKILTLGGKKPRPIPGMGVEKPDVEITATVKSVGLVEKPAPKRGRPAKVKTVEPSSDTIPVAIPGKEENGSVKYEYLTKLIKFKQIEDLQNTLNEYGDKGWELCGFDSSPKLFGEIVIFVVFKRKRG